MFPISDSEKAGKFPIITIALIGINVVVFLYMVLGGSADAVVAQYALIPSTVNFGDYRTLLPFVTSMFLHGGFFHILSNMWFLHIFGDNVEARMGVLRFLLLYLISGFIGGFLQYILNVGSEVPMMGASAAVSGILGAYLAYFPHHKIRSLVLFFFIISFVNIPAGIYLFYWFILQLFQGVASIPTLSESVGGVAFMAHVGGFAAGYYLSKKLEKKKKRDFIEGTIIE